MITLRKSSERGHADHGWLDTYHTFSFADYYDPQQMGFGALRVINEDTMQPGRGFPTHGHRDMEIVTYLLQGELEHKDSMGNGSVIRVGEVQRMSAGTGVTHSEYNASRDELVHLLQIWILPNRAGIAPSYEQKRFGDAEKQGRLRVIASPDGRDGSLTIHQDALIYSALLDSGQSVAHTLAAGRKAYLQVARGNAAVNGIALGPGDGAKIENKTRLEIAAPAHAEILLFDLA